MAMSVLAGDLVRKDRVEAILSNVLGEQGCNGEDIELFLYPIFESKEEITFQEFISNIFKIHADCDEYGDNQTGD